MTDAVVLVMILAMFGLSLLYLRGCERLKGTRP